MVICWHFGHLPLQSQRGLGIPPATTCLVVCVFHCGSTAVERHLVAYSPGQLHLLEGTVCWKANFLSAKLRKSKYLHLLELSCSRGAQANLVTIQVGCRSFIDSKSLQHVFALTLTSTRVQRSLTSKTIRMLIEVSRTIWALCNQKLMSGRHAACFPCLCYNVPCILFCDVLIKNVLPCACVWVCGMCVCVRACVCMLCVRLYVVRVHKCVCCVYICVHACT